MDRQIVYPGAIPLDTDLLNMSRFNMIALGNLLSAVLGQTTLLDGLACTPTSPASLSVSVAQGVIAQLSTIDATSFGSLSLASENLSKMGINIDPTSFTFIAPASAGQSQCFLIQAQLLEQDSGSLVLPYFNATNPAQPFSGPNNSGTPQNTQRVQRCSLQVKAGTAASSGSQVSPGADAGWVPAWVITLANGQTTITSSSIAQHPAAPFIKHKLPGLVPPAGLIPNIIGNVVILTSVTGTFVPAFQNYLAIGTGGGGGGSECQSTGPSSAQSGGGGGAGGTFIALLIGLTVGSSIAYQVGQGGSAQINGGVTGLSGLAANGGLGASFPVSTLNSAGGRGGTATGGLINLNGGDGSDGQSGTFIFAGNGGDSFWGGGGRAGNGGGIAGLPWGAGGGGAYDSSASPTGTLYYGGPGANGVIVLIPLGVSGT